MTLAIPDFRGLVNVYFDAELWRGRYADIIAGRHPNGYELALSRGAGMVPMPTDEQAAQAVNEPLPGNLIRSLDVEVRFPRWQVVARNGSNGEVTEAAGTMTDVPDGDVSAFSGGFWLTDLISPTLALDHVLGTVSVAGRQSTRYIGAWVLYRGAFFAGMPSADSYTVDRDDEWPQLSLRIVGYFGCNEYARIEFDRIEFV